MTEEQMKELKNIAQQRREEAKKTIISLRLNNKTLEKARNLGKGYTGVLSRLLDLAIEDPEMLKKCVWQQAIFLEKKTPLLTMSVV